MAKIKIMDKRGDFESMPSHTFDAPDFAPMFELDRYTPNDNDTLNTVLEYVRSKVGDNLLEMTNMIRDLRFRLGAPSRGQSKLDQIARYIKIRGKAEQLTAEAKAMEL
jgi:hypothetical protein